MSKQIEGINQFKIRAGEVPGDCSIELNGQPLYGVRQISFELDASRNEPTFLKLEIIGEVLIEGAYVGRPIAISDDVVE